MTPILIRLDRKDRAVLDALSAEDRLSRAEIIRRAIRLEAICRQERKARQAIMDRIEQFDETTCKNRGGNAPK